LKVHIKRWHNGIGEPLNEEEAKEFKNRTSGQFFSYNQLYSLNDLPRRSLGKEKKPDIIDIMYQVVKEYKEKLREIREIKDFFNELSSLSSSAQPVITTSLSQTPIIEPIIPSPVTTTMPLQPTPSPLVAPAPQQQEQKEESINLGAALVVNLFITSTIVAQDFHRNQRGKAEDSIIPRELFLPPPVNTANSDNNNNDSKKGEDFIIPREPSLAPYMMTTTSYDNNKNNNNIKNRGGEEADPTTEDTDKEEEEGEEQQLKEDNHNMEQHPSFRFNLLIDNENRQ
jgi:hypothetical protein